VGQDQKRFKALLVREERENFWKPPDLAPTHSSRSPIKIAASAEERGGASSVALSSLLSRRASRDGRKRKKGTRDRCYERIRGGRRVSRRPRLYRSNEKRRERESAQRPLRPLHLRKQEGGRKKGEGELVLGSSPRVPKKKKKKNLLSSGHLRGQERKRPLFPRREARQVLRRPLFDHDGKRQWKKGGGKEEKKKKRSRSRT